MAAQLASSLATVASNHGQVHLSDGQVRKSAEVPGPTKAREPLCGTDILCLEWRRPSSFR